MVTEGNESLNILCQDGEIVLSEYINLDYDYKAYILNRVVGDQIIELARFDNISKGIKAFNKCVFRLNKSNN